MRFWRWKFFVQIFFFSRNIQHQSENKDNIARVKHFHQTKRHRRMHIVANSILQMNKQLPFYQIQKNNQYNTMEPFQFNYFFPQDFVYCANLQNIPPGQREIQFSDTEKQRLEELNKKLEVAYEDLEKQKVKLEEQNRQLKRMIKPKRRYSKRRSDLRKDFKCPYDDCRKQYSSSIALNSHLKKKHGSKEIE